MDIKHHIGFGSEHEVDSILNSLGIVYKVVPTLTDRYLIVFDISESHQHWDVVAELIHEKNVPTLCTTVFTATEIREAEWSILRCNNPKGYPQPEDSWNEIAYLSQCQKCGVGYEQVQSFRIKKEPKLGRKDFVTLFWTEAVLCSKRVFTAFELAGIVGYQVWDVLLSKSVQKTTTVSQLICPNVAKPGFVNVDHVTGEVCSECGNTKYWINTRGQLHFCRDSILSDTDFQYTHEWFGNGGHSGKRMLLISQRVANLILDQKWKGVELKPVELV